MNFKEKFDILISVERNAGIEATSGGRGPQKQEGGKAMKTLDKYTKIVVETDEENPVTIATVTDETVETAAGYRVRLTPNYDS